MRIIAATNQDLETAIQNGGFRSDLYHRLSQINISVPPLRDRIEDIIPLAEYFRESAEPLDDPGTGRHGSVRSHRWPGDIRELQNVIIKTAVMAHGTTIRWYHLPLDARPTVRPSEAPVADLGDMEERTIFRVLQQTGGHHQRAADLLGISRRTLSRKLKLYEAESPGNTYA